MLIDIGVIQSKIANFLMESVDDVYPPLSNPEVNIPNSSHRHEY